MAADALREELTELRVLVDEGLITMADYECQSKQFLEECVKQKAESNKRRLERKEEIDRMAYALRIIKIL